MKLTIGRKGALALGSTSLLTLFLVAGCESTGKTEGQKQLDQLNSNLEEFTETLEDSKEAIQTTLAEHDAVVANTDGDLPGHYKKFANGIKRCETEQKELIENLEAIQATAAPYFAKWQQDLATINDEDLRERSQERMETVQKRLEDMRAQAEKAKEAYAPLLAKFKDHAAYLSNDLNADSASSLAKDSEDLRENAATLYEVLDKAIATTSDYRKAIAMRTEPVPAASNQ